MPNSALRGRKGVAPASPPEDAPARAASHDRAHPLQSTPQPVPGKEAVGLAPTRTRRGGPAKEKRTAGSGGLHKPSKTTTASPLDPAPFPAPSGLVKSMMEHTRKSVSAAQGHAPTEQDKAMAASFAAFADHLLTDSGKRAAMRRLVTNSLDTDVLAAIQAGYRDREAAGGTDK